MNSISTAAAAHKTLSIYIFQRLTHVLVHVHINVTIHNIYPVTANLYYYYKISQSARAQLQKQLQYNKIYARTSKPNTVCFLMYVNQRLGFSYFSFFKCVQMRWTNKKSFSSHNSSSGRHKTKPAVIFHRHFTYFFSLLNLHTRGFDDAIRWVYVIIWFCVYISTTQCHIIPNSTEFVFFSLCICRLLQCRVNFCNLQLWTTTEIYDFLWMCSFYPWRVRIKVRRVANT